MLRRLLVSSLLFFSITADADEIHEQLNAAGDAYQKEVAAIEADVVQYFDAKISEYQDQGDLDKTLATQQLKETFLTEGVLPAVPALGSYRQKVKLRFDQATRDYRMAHVRAIESYTRARDVRAAQEVKRALEDFNAAQDEAVLRFPRAGRPTKQRKDEEKPEPDPGDAAVKGAASAGPNEPKATKEAGAPRGRQSPAPRNVTKPYAGGRRAVPNAEQGFTELATQTFVYSTNNGVCTVGEGDKAFDLDFSSCNSDCIYITSDPESIKRVASARGVPSGMPLRFSDFDSTSRVYTIGEKQLFMAENEFGFYLVGRVVDVRSADRGEGADVVMFDYIINQNPGDDRLVAPPVR